MTKMQLPIPHDWDNETWACYLIQFPKSDSWTGLFLGSLSQWYRGRLWDAASGTIKDVQLIGREIFERNYPFTTCEENTAAIELSYLNWILNCLGKEQVNELPTCEELQELLIECDCEESEEDCMASVTNLKCENGILYMERCCQWVEICDLSTMLGQTIPPDAETEFTQCTFSGGYALAIYSAIGNLENYMYSVNVNTAQVITDLTRQEHAQMFLDSWLVFQAAEIYKANLSVIHAEIPEELSVDDIRCIVYELMANADNFSPNPSNISVANQFYLQIATLQQPTRDYLAKLIASINVSYIGSVVGNYRDMLFDCTCGESVLSPASGYHGTYRWWLSEGEAGGVQEASGDTIWPMAQFCIANDDPNEYLGYGIAFKIIATTAAGLVHYNNLAKPQQCVSDFDLRPDTGHIGTVLTVGQYIICDADVYAALEDDASVYTLLENATYGDAPGEGTWAFDTVGKLTWRSTESNTPFSVYATDFRIIHSDYQV